MYYYISYIIYQKPQAPKAWRAKLVELETPPGASEGRLQPGFEFGVYDLIWYWITNNTH